MSLVHKNFNFEGVNFGCWALVRVDNKIYYKLKEFSDLLGYTDPTKAYKLIDEKWKFPWSRLAPSPSYSNNWHPNTLFVSEPGIYSLMFRSRKLETKRFSHHVFEIVLPSIRQSEASPNNQDLVETLRQQLLEKDKALTEKDRLIAEMRPEETSCPDRHTLRVYRRDNTYKFSRTQKHGVRKACKRIPEGFQLVFSADNVPNVMNVLNRLKEMLPPHHFRYNSIISEEPVVDLMKQCIENETR